MPLDRLCFSSFAREYAVELITRSDLELLEPFVQVVLDSPRDDEQLYANLGIGVAFARKFGDLVAPAR